ncbi:MAG TPA: glycosyltransferase family 2 protein, partial [Gemmatimonadaceae bacterium]|nr:glycosyltransferase family 2 protein [Gemmatimonadaceae bacterium]
MSTWAVMLHYQREQIAARCLEALLASAPEPPRVLLVDACSPDGSGERLRARFPRVDYLGLRENLGYAGGNNAGIAYALERGATKVLVLNDDAEVFPDTIAQLEAALDADPQASLAAPTIYFERPGGPIFWAGGEFDVKRALGTPQPTAAPSHVTRHPSPVSFVSGCVLLIRKESLERSQAFAADYWSYGEDVELSLRHRRDGWRLLWVPTAQ